MAHLKLRSPLNTATISSIAGSDLAQGLDPTIEITSVPWRTMDKITGSDDTVSLRSADGDWFTGTVQDWDDDRGLIIMQLH